MPVDHLRYVRRRRGDPGRLEATAQRDCEEGIGKLTTAKWAKLAAALYGVVSSLYDTTWSSTA